MSGLTAVEGGAPGRMVSLDVFRGMTIAGMILVNNPGTWGAVYGPLQHAAWHGWTPTDLVFPFFPFFPFVVFGTNALALYFLAELWANLISTISLTRGGAAAPLQTILYESLFASWAAPKNVSLAYAVSTVVFWLGVMTLLYRRRIFIKV